MWEIGILHGASPLEWTPAAEGCNPILTARDITDVEAEFVADPFMIRTGDLWHLFFEVLPKHTKVGQIGVAVSGDSVHWQYRGIVLREPFHVSYPHVFAWEGEHYLIPETLQAGAVWLYKSSRFPFGWKRERALLRGRFADPTIFRHNNRWWLFVCDTPYDHWSLRLFHAPELMGAWEEHPASPIVENDCSCARPAGRMLLRDGRLVRFAQDCRQQYGDRVWAFEITELGPARYVERRTSLEPVISAGTWGGWETSRMHHIDVHSVTSGSWMACVDGWAGRKNGQS
jgi:hypothetical protein